MSDALLLARLPGRHGDQPASSPDATAGLLGTALVHALVVGRTLRPQAPVLLERA